MCFAASMWAAIPKIVFACSKEKVPASYYGGDYKISHINETLTHKIDLVHCLELEEDALAIIRRWENK